jgi:Protein of unknown function (DUF998)
VPPAGPVRKLARARYGTIGGLLLVVAGAAILMGIITAEALYPAAYNTHRNTISDLGAMRPLNLIRQPSAAIFDWTMIVTGILVIAAACFLHRALSRWGPRSRSPCSGQASSGWASSPETTSQHTGTHRFA